MISYIIGTIVNITPNAIVLDHNGIGYFIYFPSRDIENVRVGMSDQKIYTYLNVREGVMELYGFLSEEEEEFFELLITVNNVGPKAAVNILGTFSVKDLQFAILADDDKTISKAPGIGKKTAQKIILDLKDKVDILDATGYDSSAGSTSINLENENPARSDAILALNALGYSTTEILQAMSKIESDPDRSTQGWMQEAMKHLAGNL